MASLNKVNVHIKVSSKIYVTKSTNLDPTSLCFYSKIHIVGRSDGNVHQSSHCEFPRAFVKVNFFHHIKERSRRLVQPTECSHGKIYEVSQLSSLPSSTLKKIIPIYCLNPISHAQLGSNF